MKKINVSLFILILLVSSCSKKTDEPVNLDLKISSFAPSAGFFSTLVTINGFGFSSVLSENNVKFNSVVAVVKSASPTKLTVEVPKSAGSGKISIEVNGKSAESDNFEYIYTAMVSTFAGSGKKGFADGSAAVAQFSGPHDVAVDDKGNVYVADQFNNRIRKITSAGDVTTIAGTGIEGFLDGNSNVAMFFQPCGISVDGAGNLYVADTRNNRIRKITSSGIVSTLAGSGPEGFTDGTGTAARFNAPIDVATDKLGNIYVADLNNHAIRKVTGTGIVNTFAGNGTRSFADGTGTMARFFYPSGVEADAQGNVYVGDAENNRIRKISTSAVVSTIGGSGAKGFEDGSALIASFSEPNNVAIDLSGNIYVSDHSNNSIRKISKAGIVSRISGTGIGGFLNGEALLAKFNSPYGLTVDSKGNIFVADHVNNLIRKITFD